MSDSGVAGAEHPQTCCYDTSRKAEAYYLFYHCNPSIMIRIISDKSLKDLKKWKNFF